jgi:hypothetical protein
MTEQNISLSSTDSEISLKDLFLKLREWFAYLLSKWIVIVVATIIGAGIGFIYGIDKKTIYTASLSFVLEDEKSGGSGLSSAFGLASQFGIDVGGSAGGVFSANNLLELFKSRRMVEQTLLRPVKIDGNTITFAEWYIEINQWRKQWAKKGVYKNIQFLPNTIGSNFSKQQNSVMKMMHQKITNKEMKVATKDKKASILILEVKSTDELFAQYFTEAIIKEVSDFYVLTKSKKANLNMAILQRQTDSIRAELNLDISGVAVANDNIFGLNSALTNVKRVPSTRRQVDVQANTAILTALVQQTEMAKVTLRKETPLIEIIDLPTLPLLSEEFNMTTALISGGFLSGFLMMLGVIFRKVLKDILK